MSGTIVTYLGECREPFSRVPLNEVDSLVLSTVAYFYFEHGALTHLHAGERMRLPLALCGIRAADMFGDVWVARMGGEQLLHALFESPRFMDLWVGDYVTETSHADEKQFAAVTFYLPDGSVYVAFRGTDSSLVGWKEDFNLSYLPKVPSQERARAYLQDVAQRCEGVLYIGGHSKGGNLAEYATLTCDDGIYERIVGVFSHDGPAFAHEPSARMHDASYSAKLHKSVPESSVIGMLMESRKNLTIVHADGVLFAQHASTHWAVEGQAFTRATAITPDAEIVGRTVNNWASAYEPAKRELLVNALFDILGAGDASTWVEWGKDYLGNSRAVFEAALKLPPDLRNELTSMFMDIAKVFGSEARDVAFDVARDVAHENVPAAADAIAKLLSAG
ncbi:MAG: DUF2974 domain-containing protein, partial [Eggerthellaceae bacterium]|nr:DUF2974 domain-containing protein [Eggerthellaceae bacterium]